MRKQCRSAALPTKGRLPIKSAVDKWKPEEKIALAIISGLGLLAAIEMFYRHPTYGNGVKALVAALGFIDG